MLKTNIIIIIITLSILPFSYSSILAQTPTLNDKGEDRNYYNGPGGSLEWESLTRRYPDDMMIRSLRALKYGLRSKLDKGDLDISQAAAIYKKMKKALINKKEKDRKAFSMLIYLCWYIASVDLQSTVSEK